MTVWGERGKHIFKQNLIIALKWLCRINWQRKELWLKFGFGCYLDLGIKMSLHRNTKTFTHFKGYGSSKTYVEINSLFSEGSLYLK